jgi:hypothetical protein
LKIKEGFMAEIIPRHRVMDDPRQEPAREQVEESRTIVTPPPKDATSERAVREVESPFTSQRAADMASTDAEVADEKTPLLPVEEGREMRSRWDRIQVEFIDQPRRSVEEANALVSDTMTRLNAVFMQEREKMERQWDRKEDVSTEDLRQALRRYRTFFTRLLTV